MIIWWLKVLTETVFDYDKMLFFLFIRKCLPSRYTTNTTLEFSVTFVVLSLWVTVTELFSECHYLIYFFLIFNNH